MTSVEATEQSAGLRRYGDVLRVPGVGRIAAAAVLARLPSGMTPLATVLLVRDEGRSYAVAGVVVAATSVASAVGSPLWGRLIDRGGQARVLLPLAVAYPAALLALVLSATQGAPAVVLALFAALSGATMPPIGACMRTLWPSLLGSPGLRDTAYALEAWLQELFFILGPLVVAMIATFAPAWTTIVVAAALAGAGTVWFALAPAVLADRGSPRAVSRAGALGSRAVRTVMISCVALGAGFGVVEVTMPAFGEAHGSRAQGGLVLACFAAGSLIGGLWIGTRPAARRLGLRFALSLGLLAVALLPPLVAPSLPVMCVLMLLAGMPIAPAFAASYGLVGELAPSGTTTEAFAWLTTAIVTGLALGTAVGGVAVEHLGLTEAIALAAPCVGVAALAAFIRLASLAIPEPVP
jgi:MFS family permease